MSKDLEMDPIAEAHRQWEAHGWESAAAGMATVTTLVRVHRILTTRIEAALAPFGLTFARFEILRLLGFTRHGSLPMGKIGQRLQVHPASVTSAVKRLERDGLIQRQEDGADGRIVLAVLTAQGRQLLLPATEAVNSIFESLGLQDGVDLDALVSLLNAIRVTGGDTVQHRETAENAKS